MPKQFWLKPQDCMIVRDGRPYFRIVSTMSSCTEPETGQLFAKYIAEKLTGNVKLTDCERTAFDDHYHRCLACSCAVDNFRFRKAASDYTGLPLDDPQLEQHFERSVSRMSQVLFENAVQTAATSDLHRLSRRSSGRSASRHRGR